MRPLVLAALLCAPAALAEETMTATLVEGAATVQRGGDTQPLAEGAALREGDTVQTGAASRVEISLPSGSVIRLGEGSRFALGSSVPQKSFSAKLFLGNLWTRVHKLLADETFHIETENAVAGVRGTEFRVEVAEGQSDLLRVYEGAVEVQDRAGGWSHRIEPGNELRFQRERRPDGPRPFDAEAEKEHKFMRWVRSRATKDGAEPGRIRRHEFRNPEKEHRRRERRRRD